MGHQSVRAKEKGKGWSAMRSATKAGAKGDETQIWTPAISRHYSQNSNGAAEPSWTRPVMQSMNPSSSERSHRPLGPKIADISRDSQHQRSRANDEPKDPGMKSRLGGERLEMRRDFFRAHSRASRKTRSADEPIRVLCPRRPNRIPRVVIGRALLRG